MKDREIGSYILESPLGRGGMGEVWLARHKSLGTRAAIKVLSVAVDEPQFHERFSLEARTQAQMSHPHIARVLDHVQKDGRWYLITEYMHRGTLKDVLTADPGPVPVEQALAWARQSLEGLEHAHAKGIVHRDIKPANILLNDRGEAAVTDFGLAKVIGGARLTQTGTALGTPAYMSPEQVSGDSEIDHRTDIYSMGVVLYELLTGRVPIPMETASEVVRVLVSDPPPLRQINPELPAELEGLVMKALAKNPRERYADCGEFARAVAACEHGAEATVATGAAVAAAVAPPPPPPPPPPAAAPTDGPSGVDPTYAGPTLVAASGETPAPSRRGSVAGLVAAAVVLLLLIGAFGAGALYFLWPMLQKADEPEENAPLAVANLPAAEDEGLPEVEERDPFVQPEAEQFEVADVHIEEEKAEDRSDGSDRSDLGQLSPPPPSALPASPPPPRPRLPDQPVVAVIAVGDPLFASGFEAEVEGRLAGEGFDVADERNSLVVGDILRRWGDDVAIPDLLPMLEDEGFHVLVLVQVEFVGYRELQYLGRYSQATQARLRLNSYLIPTHGSLGSGWSEAVEYTELNAATKAETAMFEPAAEMAGAIREGWYAFVRRHGG